MGEIKNNGGIRTTTPYIKEFRKAVGIFEIGIKNWREIYEVKIENSGKELIELQEYEIEKTEKELGMRKVEKSIIESMNLIVEKGKFLQELSEEPLRIYPINCLRHNKDAMNMLGGIIDFFIQLQRPEEISSLIKGEGDFWRSDEKGENAIDRFFEYLKN